MRLAILLILAAAALPAADTSPEGLRQLVRQCLVNLDKTDAQMRGYEYTIHEDSKEYEGHAAAKTRSVVMRRGYIDGLPVNRVLARNGTALTPAEQQKNEEELKASVATRKAETPEQREKQAAERRKRNAERESWYKEAPEALDYKLAGEDTLDGRKMLIVAFSPHPGYHPKNLWSRVLEKMTGKIWVDPEESEIARAEAGLSGDVTIGWGLVARINQGSHFTLTRSRAAPHVWLTGKQTASYSARIVFKTIRGESTTEFSDFAPRRDQEARAAR